MSKLEKYGDWALITGASSGIGKEFARAIARQGLNCILVARRGDRLQELAAELEKEHGCSCRCIVQDLTDDGAVSNIVEATKDIPVGILVNNAGFGYPGHFETRDPERFEHLIKLNCTAPVLLTHAFISQMLERKKGAVIMLASVLGFIPAPFDSVYSASKAFDLFFGEALWAEMRGTGVDVITLAPNVTRTEFFAVEGMDDEGQAHVLRNADKPEDVVNLVLRKLGRKMTVAPWSGFYPSLIARMIPRAATARIMRFFMMKDLRSDQVE